jgi:mono/diheme cytochrome c family protein
LWAWRVCLLTVALSGVVGGGVAGAEPRSVRAGPSPTGDVARGAEIAGLAGCAACHTAAGGPPLAGGYALPTPSGTFYGTNLTPDPDHGLGAWSLQDFDRALRHGRSPAGHAYWPAFPYTSFTGLTDQEVADLWAWVQSFPPVPTPNRTHDVDRERGILGLWRRLYFVDRGGPRPFADPVLDRGQHLAEVVGHCGECHTPRGPRGNLLRGRAYTGSTTPPEPAPAIDRTSLAAWSEADWVTFLELGMTPNGDFVGGEMARVVREGTSRLNDSDRHALARYFSR